MAKLLVISKAQRGLAHHLGKRWVTIGRSPGNAFQIPESSVSGQHCEVLLRGSELIVRDMRSTNGTFIKGRLVTEGALRAGETLRLGEIELRLEMTDEDILGSSSQPNIRENGANGASRPHSAAKQHQVLLVDDSMAFLETAGELFETFANGRWQIHRACGADQGLSIIQQHKVELVALDLNMPVLDGVQLLGMLHRRHPEVKKVVLSAGASDVTRAHCLASGAELFLEKPVSQDGMRFVFNVLNDLITWNQREGFSGTLQQVGLTDIIQIECLRRNSCILGIQTAEAQGEIYIESGSIIHAVTGTITGEKAFHRLLSLNAGQFHLHPFRPPLERTVQGSWECLLMESAQRHDEEKGARPADETVFIKRSTPGKIQAADSSLNNFNGKSEANSSSEPPPASDAEIPELGEDIVVVSTYDGKWSRVDETKEQ
jgi:CheY-like chemotaxis protein